VRHLLDTNACVDYLTGRYPWVVAPRGSSVVTDNVGEFGRVKGLKVENWRL